VGAGVGAGEGEGAGEGAGAVEDDCAVYSKPVDCVLNAPVAAAMRSPACDIVIARQSVSLPGIDSCVKLEPPSPDHTTRPGVEPVFEMEAAMICPSDDIARNV
jgi:hypothetical protein